MFTRLVLTCALPALVFGFAPVARADVPAGPSCRCGAVGRSPTALSALALVGLGLPFVRRRSRR